jgi:DNA processing protein
LALRTRSSSALRESRRLRPSEPNWPKQLQALENPPTELRLCGQLPELHGAVAVVGTRAADDDALDFATDLGAELAAAGRTVISGGAIGIDAAAHRGALKAGGATLAVLANGFDPPFPRGHARLFEEIVAAGGALLSELEDGYPAERWTFLSRNRLIAALAEAVIVVQAPVRSGALSTAAAGARLKRRVLTVPYAPWDRRGEGCVWLLRQGAEICTSSRDVLSVRAHGTGPARRSVLPHEEKPFHVGQLDSEVRAVWDALGRRPRHPDDLAATLGLPIMSVQRFLLELLLQGAVVELAPGRYARNRDREQR